MLKAIVIDENERKRGYQITPINEALMTKSSKLFTLQVKDINKKIGASTSQQCCDISN